MEIGEQKADQSEKSGNPARSGKSGNQSELETRKTGQSGKNGKPAESGKSGKLVQAGKMGNWFSEALLPVKQK